MIADVSATNFFLVPFACLLGVAGCAGIAVGFVLALREATRKTGLRLLFAAAVIAAVDLGLFIVAALDDAHQ